MLFVARCRMTIKIKNRQISFILIGIFLTALSVFLAEAFIASNGVGNKINEIGCESSYATGCDAINSNGIIDNADTAVTATTASNAQKLDNLDSTAFCRSTGTNCPVLKGSLSCVEETGSSGATSSVACDTGYKVVGGGCSGSYRIFKTKKSSNGWYCEPISGTITAHAMCCKII